MDIKPPPSTKRREGSLHSRAPLLLTDVSAKVGEEKQSLRASPTSSLPGEWREHTCRRQRASWAPRGHTHTQMEDCWEQPLAPLHDCLLAKVTLWFISSGGCGLVAKLCPTLVTPRTIVCQAPLSMGFSRKEYWSGLPFPPPGDLPDPGNKPRFPAFHKSCLHLILLSRDILLLLSLKKRKYYNVKVRY